MMQNVAAQQSENHFEQSFASLLNILRFNIPFYVCNEWSDASHTNRHTYIHTYMNVTVSMSGLFCILLNCFQA